MTFEEIELLKKGFAARHLTINLPDDDFIVQVVKYLDRMTDGYKEYKILGAFYFFSSCTQRKPVVDLSTTVNGVFTNLWTQFIRNFFHFEKIHNHRFYCRTLIVCDA